MCLYITGGLDKLSVPNTIAPKPPAGGSADLLHLPYSSAKSYDLAADAVPNNVYAVNGPHPSERVIGMAESSTTLPSRLEELHFDSVISYSSTLAVLPTEAPDDFFIGPSTMSHMYTHVTCENLATYATGSISCTGKSVGAKCEGFSRGVLNKGYCYKSDIGSMECGRTLDIQPRFTSTPPITVPYQYAKSPSRCPAGTPLSSPGKRTVRAMLIGGCMVSSDAHYDKTAEIHVPSACDVTTTNAPGCIFPGALNYLPGAVEPTKCLYKLNGCTSPTALNYNSEASHNDGSCVEPVLGCTVPQAQYGGVESSTPGYKSLYGSKPLPNVGRVPYAAYGAAISHSSTANVLANCIIAVEGCMDPTAHNYDPLATINSNTWCVPRVEGCMLPEPGLLSSATGAKGTRVHLKDGGATNYSAAATVHNGAYCVTFRAGCTDSTAVNYDVLASEDDGSCYYSQKGCFDNTALNFNCTSHGITKCIGTIRKYAPTIHDEEYCTYTIAPPPSPLPNAPPGAAVAKYSTFSLTATGTVSSFTDDKKEEMKKAVAELVGTPTENIGISITAASVRVMMTIDLARAGLEADATNAKLSAALATPEEATIFFSAAGVDVISTPVVETIVMVVATPPAPPPEVDAGGIVGAVFGAIGGALMLCGIVAGVKHYKKSKGATYPA